MGRCRGTQAPVPDAAELSWLQPIPEALVTPESADPASVVATRDSLRLALVASLQKLPPRQRAVLVLREVLQLPAAEVAAMLDTSTAAVKSSLQRAGARLAEAAATPGRVEEPTDPQARALLEQYVAGFEHADLAALERALRADATIERIGSRTWFAGRSPACGSWPGCSAPPATGGCARPGPTASPRRWPTGGQRTACTARSGSGCSG